MRHNTRDVRMMSTQVLEKNTIILWCKECEKSTRHRTVVKDQWTNKWREIRQPPKLNFTPKGISIKHSRQCEECDNIVKF